MHPTTLRALERAAELTRQNRLVDAWLIAEPVVLTADEHEAREIRRWLIDRTTLLVQEKEIPQMPLNRRFRRLIRVGPVQVGTAYDNRGREKHMAACTAPRCGFSADYDSRAAAELAARTHRCAVR